MSLLKPPAFGLDISDSFVKAVYFKKRDGGSPKLVAAGIRALPAGAVDSGQIVNPEAVVKEIGKLLKETKPNPIEANHVVCAVSESQIFLKTIELPVLPEEQLAEAVTWESRSAAPIPPEKAYYDWKILRRREEKIEVLVVAAKREVVDALDQTVRLAGLIPIAYDLVSAATIRALPASLTGKRAFLLADIGGKKTTLTVVSEGIPWFTNVAAIGGERFTKLIADQEKIAFEEAEKKKSTKGLEKPKIAASLLDDLAKKINSVIEFHNSRVESEEKVTAVVLTGGGAALAGLQEQLNKRIKAIIEEAQFGLGSEPPLASMVRGKPFPYLTAIGLALRGAEVEVPVSQFDLLPQEGKKALADEELARVVELGINGLILLLAAVLSSLLSLYIIFRFDLKGVNEQVRAAEFNLQGHPAREHISWARQMNKTLKKASVLAKSKSRLGDNLAELARETPEAIRFTSLKIGGSVAGWELAGIGGRNQIVQFYQRLVDSDRFVQVDMPFASLSGEGADFTVTFSVRR